MQKFAIIAGAAVVVISLGIFFINAALTAKYNEGVAECAKAAAEAAALVKDAALEVQRKAMQAEIDAKEAQLTAERDAVVALERINGELARQRQTAIDEAVLAISEVPDGEWFFLSEPVTDSVLTDINSVQ